MSKDRPEQSQTRVLIIDDQREILFCMQKALQAEGYDVVMAADGNEGVASIEVFDPQVVVLDIMMPKRSGILVLEYIRTQIEKPIPVIMVTGSEGNRHREYAEHFGISDYLVKPFQMPVLVDAVERALAESRAS